MKLEWKLPAKLPAFLERYKYPILIVLLGVILMLWPSHEKQEEPYQEPQRSFETVQAEPAAQDNGMEYCRRTEQKLEAALSQIHGAGRVRVMLTLKSGPAASYQTDKTRTETQEGERSSLSSEEKTVMVDRGSAYNEPAVVSTVYPVFQGALIVAEGGADETVRYQLCAAVSALLGLGTDQITVVKMK